MLGSDERLIARLRAGDTRAFETIYDRYERPIRSFCRHMLGQPEDADDAAQHVFLSAYKALIGTGNAIELKPWLFAIARNRCRTMLRGRQRGLGIAEPVEREPSVEGLSVEVERREHLHDLLRDISRLPEEQRAALILTQLETLRHDEVARVLAVPPDKVKALVFQARESLMASQQARETPCREIREQLATLSGAGLRRRTLRRHLRDCTGCRDFELGLARQRVALSALLPVAATPVIRQLVIGHALGGGSSASGAAGTARGVAAKAGALKAATVLALAAAGTGAVLAATHPRQAVANDGSRAHVRGSGTAGPPARVARGHVRQPLAAEGGVSPPSGSALGGASPPGPGLGASPGSPGARPSGPPPSDEDADDWAPPPLPGQPSKDTDHDGDG